MFEGGASERGDPPPLGAAVPLVNGFFGQWKLVGGQLPTSALKGASSYHMDLSHLTERPPGWIVAKQRFDWAFGQILCLAGKSIVFGTLCVPNHHLPSILLARINTI